MSAVASDQLQGNSPPGRPAGVACAILTSEPVLVFVLEGDRHNMTDAFRADWNSHFCNGNSPHTVYRVDYNKKLTVFPAAVMTDPAQGNSLTPDQYGRYILMHMISKKWFPKCVFTDEQAESFVQGNKHKDGDACQALVQNVPGEKIVRLVEILEEFSMRIDKESLSLLEIIMGGIEKGEDLKTTVVRETFEEAGVQGSSSGGHQQVGWSEPFVNRKNEKCCTALFVLNAAKDTIESEWSQASNNRAKESNWFCAHSWYKFVPFIDQALMSKEKAVRETRNGRFLAVTEAMSRLDKKSCIAMKGILTSLGMACV